MRSEWKKIAIAFVSCSACLSGCCGEPGRLRANRAQAVGVYEALFRNGRERLELKSDGTYVQDFVSKTRPFQHTGRWHIESHVFGGSVVILVSATVGEGDETKSLGVGDYRLNVHDHSGKVALARNEVMDWYYERVQ
jgi:hypothetical protein